MGLSRCITLASDGDWDTHEDNAEQAPAFNNLFAQLDRLMSRLTETLDQAGRPLIEETTVVVLSEMGRTPKYNETGGRDHWPYGTAMLMGAGIRGNRQYGAYDEKFTGIGIDPGSGSLVMGRLGTSSQDFGATLLTLAGIDSRRYLPQATPIHGMIT